MEGETNISYRFMWNDMKRHNCRKDQIENRIYLVECLIAVLSINTHKSLNERFHDPFIFFLNFQNLRHPNYVESFLLSLLNNGLSFKSNGVIPFSYKLYNLNAEERLSQLCIFTINI